MKKLFWILGCVAALAAALLAANALFGCCKKTEEAAEEAAEGGIFADTSDIPACNA